MSEMTLPTGALPWAVAPEALPLAVRLAEPPAAGEDVDDALEVVGQVDDGRTGRAQVAVLRAVGPCIDKCPAWAERWGYAYDPGRLADRIEVAAMAANSVAVLFDSPGGGVAGVEEAAARIAAVAEQSLVVAVADHLMASAAYWLGSACTAVAASPSAMVGSVGVVTVHASYERMYEQAGIDVTVISAGRGKADTAPYSQLTDAAAERLQAVVDGYYRSFSAAVAKNRRVPPKRVRGEWGALLMLAAEAKAAGMADLVADSRTLVAKLASAEGRRQVRRAAAARAIIPSQVV